VPYFKPLLKSLEKHLKEDKVSSICKALRNDIVARGINPHLKDAIANSGLNSSTQEWISNYWFSYAYRKLMSPISCKRSDYQIAMEELNAEFPGYKKDNMLDRDDE
jgi:hypothetical protein